MEPLYKIDPAKAALHISKGNSKIGPEIYSFSTLPGNEKHMMELRDGTLLTDVPGTCSRHCEACFGHGCYAVNAGRLHSNACIPAWGENTVLLRSGRLWGELETFLRLKNAKAEKIIAEWRRKTDPRGSTVDIVNSWAAALKEAREAAKVRTFRINVSGEIETSMDLFHWNTLAAKHPYIAFGLYTKNFDALEEFLDKWGDFVEPNFVINVSQWHGVADGFLAKHGDAKLNVFEYCDSNRKGSGLSEGEIARMEALPKCPAVTRGGGHATLPDGSPITCSMCGRCYRRTGAHIGVWAH